MLMIILLTLFTIFKVIGWTMVAAALFFWLFESKEKKQGREKHEAYVKANKERCIREAMLLPYEEAQQEIYKLKKSWGDL